MMKKRAILFLFVLLTTMVLMSYSVYAAVLNINVKQSDTTIKPGEEVTLTLNFGTELATYTFYFDYDSTKLEYISNTGGNANSSAGKTIVTYTDTTVGSNLKESMTITFRAKSDISNQTLANIQITADGLGTADANSYEDILTPIVKSITIQPESTPSPTPSATPTPTPTPTSTTQPTPMPEEAKTSNKMPKELPKTGINLYIVAFSLILILVASYIYISKKK